MEVPTIFLNRILVEAAKRSAISLHLSVGSLPILKIDNGLAEMENESMVSAELINKIISSFLADDEKAKLEKEKEIIVVKNLAGDFRFRINIFYQKELPSLSFHHIPETIKSPKELKLPQVINNLINISSGLFIFSGSQLSGKTTTVASIIEEINKISKKFIITIEDPVEYIFKNQKSIIEQRQVGRDVISVESGLKHCLEKDADIIYISEIKEEFEKAIPLVIEMAAGNALVLLEINADSVLMAIDKVLNSLEKKLSTETARYALADVLIGAINQRLLPHRGGGLVMACEIMLMTPPVKSLIRDGKIYQIESIIQTSKREGMINMERAIEELIKSGEVKQEDLGGSIILNI